MEALIAVLLIYICIYGGFIIALIIGYNRVQTFVSGQSEPETTFSIIIPFRNEQNNLSRLLDSLALLEYPQKRFEVIFVDDNSDDFSVNVINKWRMANGLIQSTLLENLRLTNSPKKDAITRAMQIVENKWVITTDADCRVDRDWLKIFDSYMQQTNFEMVAGPVNYEGRISLLNHFQHLDFMSLQGATIGSFGLGNAFMCNGANFAYTKNLFQELNGFRGNDNEASGDDVFLLQKAMAKYPKKVGYLKSDAAIVTTVPAGSWLQLFNQRIRWASKTNSYQSHFGEDLALVVFLANLCLLIVFFLAVFSFVAWSILAIAFVLKSIPDFILLVQTNRFLRKGKFFFPVISAFIFPFFCVTVALFSISGKYNWKGRQY